MRGETGSDGHLDKAPGGSSGSVCEPVQILVFSLRLFSSLLLSQGKNHSAAIVVVFLFHMIHRVTRRYMMQRLCHL
ncbi:hypothetical protein F2P81_020577 [Scophthalmus maximus]|uniref:Uncharacterized protein n=1 Tax=Scophthalmus maximus TaxID=52904 RepID=A0A6A4RYC1_SCOMX|nr:hypothetical protein F2P81_020577 [Scophthalmus maximus]